MFLLVAGYSNNFFSEATQLRIDRRYLFITIISIFLVMLI